MKPNITLAQAKKLAIIKWELIANNKGYYSPEHRRNPAIKDLKHQCGFCERWRTNDTGVDGSGCDCNSCEFAKALGSQCNDKDNGTNLFFQWWYADLYGDEPTKLAQQILDLIKSIPTTKCKST
jgi:hypothetical protein